MINWPFFFLQILTVWPSILKMKNCYQKIPSFELLSFHFRHFQSAPPTKKKNGWQSTHTTSKTANYPLSWSDLHKTLVCMVQGGVLRFSLDRVCRSSLETLSLFKGHFGRKGYLFLGFFSEYRALFTIFGFLPCEVVNTPSKKKKLERGTHFRDGVFFFFFFFWKRWDPCLGISY